MPFVLETPPPYHTQSYIHNTIPSTGSVFSKFAKRISGKSSKTSSTTSASKTNSWASSNSSTSRGAQLSSTVTQNSQFNTYGASIPNELPPSYQDVVTHGGRLSAEDDRYAFLQRFDTVILCDDSSSMMGDNWKQTRDALAAITPICTKYDSDGIDIYFLNAPDNPYYHNVKSSSTVAEIFSSVRPRGATPTGQKLHDILKRYLNDFSKRGESMKPLNIIIITDGEATDDVESTLIAAAKKLDRHEAPAWQIGIQFFQVGNSTSARQYLKYLDDNLCDRNGREIRDMVDTVPWTGDGGMVLNAEGILKVVLGAVNRRLDRSGVSFHQMRN